MKKIIYTLLLTLVVASSAFASGESKSRSGVVSHFKVQFKKVPGLFWTNKRDIAKTELLVGGKKTEIFYEANGDLIGSTTNVTLNELPEGIQKQLSETLAGFSVKEAIRLSSPEETAYYILAQNNQETIVLKVNESNTVTTMKNS